MATPTWLAATAGLQGNSGMVTQFLGTHASQWVYAGTLQDQQPTGSAAYQSLEAGYLSQTLTTGAAQSAIARVALQISTVGGSPLSATISPLTVSLYASSSGLPTGAALAITSLTEPYVYSSPFWLSIPLLATGLTPSTVYNLVVTGAGSAGAYYVWQQSNQTQGAASSPDAATWSAQAFGLMYQQYDQSTGGPLQAIVDDGGARMTTFAYSAGQRTGLSEYTVTQSGGALASSRTLTYSNGLLVGVN